MNKTAAILCAAFSFLCLAVFADEDGKRVLGKLDTMTKGTPTGILGIQTDTTSGPDGVPGESGELAGVPSPPPSRRPDLKGREMTAEVAAKYPPDKFVSRVVVNNAWDVGENLVFSVDYGFYRAGTASMSVMGAENVNGGVCYHIRTTAESNNFISSFYKVRDKVDTYIDMKGIFSRRFEKRLREGGFSSDEFVDVYQDRLIALSTKQKRALVEVPLYVQDILSTLYYIRTFDLHVGKNETIETYADGKVYPLKVLVYKKEKIEVPAGTFMCILVEPVLKSEGIFRQKGRLLVWLTDDKNRIPVKMTSKVAIGNIAAKLEYYRKSAEK